MRPTGLRTEDLLLAAWNAVGVPLVAVSVLGPVLTLGDEPLYLVSAVFGIGWLAVAAG